MPSDDSRKSPQRYRQRIRVVAVIVSGAFALPVLFVFGMTLRELSKQPEPSIYEAPAAAPEPSTPETDSPESSAPQSSAPEPLTPETDSPESSALQSSAPEPLTPETDSPESSALQSSAPEPSTPQAATSDTTSIVIPAQEQDPSLSTDPPKLSPLPPLPDSPGGTPAS